MLFVCYTDFLNQSVFVMVDVDLLWEETIVRSLKRTAKVIWSLVHCNSIGSPHTHIGALLPEWSTSIELWINRKYISNFVLFVCYTYFLNRSGFVMVDADLLWEKNIVRLLKSTAKVIWSLVYCNSIGSHHTHIGVCCPNAEVHQLNCELIGSIRQIS